VRTAFINELVQIAQERDDIALVVGDLGFSVVEPFADAFPDRFINAGVAEQNMTGMAAGMASEGYHVFTYSIANFPTFRCAEQIRNDVAYHQLPVTVVAVGGGLAYGALGYSHHAVQDYALIRTMPNMLIAAPGDPMEVRACVRYLVDHPGPSYLRIGKAGEPTFHPQVPAVEPGRWLPVLAGTGTTSATVTTGAALGFAMERRRLHGGEEPVFSMPLWSMDSKRLQPRQAEPFHQVRTMEDHLVDGGFGSWMLESLTVGQTEPKRVLIEALDPVVCGTVGSQTTLNALGGLTSELRS
jgi:transketolase